LTPTNQYKDNAQKIKDRIYYYLDKGMTDKSEIYSKVVEDCNAPRPTVRRIARDVRTELFAKMEILQGEGK